MRTGILQALPAIAIPFLAAAQEGPVELHVFPPEVELSTQRDRQSFVVQAVYADRMTQDVTAEAEIAFAADGIVRRDGRVLHPQADGETVMAVVRGPLRQEVPVRVVRAAEERPISFRLDVMPVFLRAGCNTGSCHGSARGQDRFRLSLFGFDPAGDYYRLTREMNGRRINLAVPEESLLIRKSVGAAPHSGGERFPPDSRYHDALVRWLQEAAPDDGPDIPHPVALEIMPDRMVLAAGGAAQQLTVRATYSDGTDRDVTDLAVFLGNNDVAAAVWTLRQEGFTGRVLIIDTDAHQGDGNHAAFAGDPSVYTLSLQQEKIFPLPRVPGDRDVELRGGMDDGAYAKRLDKELAAAFEGGEFALVIHVAGSDVLWDDPLAGLGLTVEGLVAKDLMVMRAARSRDIPYLHLLAGGYGPSSAEGQAASVAAILEEVAASGR